MEVGFWSHLFIFLAFLNYLPYSKHLHLLAAFPHIFLKRYVPRGQPDLIDFEDEVVRGATVCREGEITYPPPPPQISAAPPKPAPAPAPAPKVEKKKSFVGPIIGMVLAGLALLGMGSVAPDDFMAMQDARRGLQGGRTGIGGGIEGQQLHSVATHSSAASTPSSCGIAGRLASTRRP